jgi:hypothetical protein
MSKLVLYADDPRELTAYDTEGRRWDGFYGVDFYRFECQHCGQTKSNGWVRYSDMMEICMDCVMPVYMAEVLR